MIQIERNGELNKKTNNGGNEADLTYNKKQISAMSRIYLNKNFINKYQKTLPLSPLPFFLFLL